MGFFSWLTSDTKESISNVYSRRGAFQVHVITEAGEVFTEEEYEGYGKFGGMDIYSLIGYLNGYTGEQEDVREKVFKELLCGGIKKGKVRYYYGKDFDNYQSPIEAEGGKTATQLLQKEGFMKIFPHFEFSEFIQEGIVVPKIVRHLPKEHCLMTKSQWSTFYHSLSFPENCPDQGCFY